MKKYITASLCFLSLTESSNVWASDTELTQEVQQVSVSALNERGWDSFGPEALELQAKLNDENIQAMALDTLRANPLAHSRWVLMAISNVNQWFS